MEKQSTDRPARKQVSLRGITTKTETFQFRHVEVDQHHVDELATVLETGRPLDRLTLWTDPETGELVVVDGHHRLAAYRQVGWRKKVPVAAHSCGIEEARLFALRENGKTRLPLTRDERIEAAQRRYLGSTSTGESIDRGFMRIAVGVAMGLLARIANRAD